MPEAVVTWLLTAEPDPQRHVHMASSVDLLAELRASVAGHGRHLIVLHDCLDEPDDERTTFVRVPPGRNPYFHRWAVVADLLEARPDLSWLFCVDGTDTEMLHDPFPFLKPGRLYVGSEPHTIGGDRGAFDWTVMGDPDMEGWLRANGDLPMLNMGILGGHRDVVAEAASAIAARDTGQPWELGCFQQIGYETFAGRLVTGPMVHSEFKAMDRASLAWWRHK